MPGWLPPVLCVEAALWAAFFAQLGHRRRHDHAAAEPCARVALCLLIAAAGFRLIAWGAAPQPADSNRAARIPRTAPVAFLHAPISFPAPARDSDHRFVDLLARDDR